MRIASSTVNSDPSVCYGVVEEPELEVAGCRDFRFGVPAGNQALNQTAVAVDIPENLVRLTSW